MYLFIRQSESGKAPIEAIMPEVVRMPLYRLIKDPLGTVLGGGECQEKCQDGRF